MTTMTAMPSTPCSVRPGSALAGLLLLGLSMQPGWAEQSGAEHTPGFHWPANTQAAVSLAYDDALASQLDVAIPALDRHGLKGSFYLTMASPTVAHRLADWRAAAANGHELGNHTLFHQCSRSQPGRDWVRPEQDLDTLTLTALHAQILLANTMLHAMDGKHERTFAVPCGDLLVAGEPYLPAIQAEFVAIKALAGTGITTEPLALNPYAVSVLVASDLSGAQLIALVEQAAREQGMVNLTFHGIGSEHLSVSKEAHETLLAYLAANRQRYWTDTFIEIMRYVKTQQAVLAVEKR